MSNELKNRCSKLLRYLADSLDIPESHYKQAEERYRAVGNWLGRDKSVVAKLTPKIYPQGSFRLGTVIKPVSDAEEYDIDLVCELIISKDQISQKELKELVGFEIKGYAQANNMRSQPEEGKRCWTLNYADGAEFHMDILPAIPDGKSFRVFLESRGLANDWSDQAICITDNTLPNYDQLADDWPHSNPRGYAEWFKGRMKTQFDAQRMLLAKSIRCSVEDVPEYKVKTPLQRAVQILKRHRDIMFADDQDNKPISIIITTLAAQAYNNEADLLEALLNIVNSMPLYIDKKDGITWVPNPVNPLENFADKWQKHPHREENFRRWLQQVSTDLNVALESKDIDAIAESLKPSFGERVINEALKHFSTPSGATSKSLIIGAPRLPSRFNVPHRQPPRWPVMQQGLVSITGRAYRNGFRPWQIQSDSSPLPKHCSLRFEAWTNVPWPYKVYWQVVNTGYEAKAANCLRGGFYDGIEKGGRIREESTLYSGMHWIECFIIKEGACVARSGEFVVNIE